MKIIQEFKTFTHLKESVGKLSLILIVTSLIYCIMFSFVQTMIYMGNPIYYYAALYVFVIWSAYIYMLILFQFVQKKRGIQDKLKLKSYILPLWGVQTIFYIVLIGSSWLLLSFAGSDELSIFYYVMTPICILLTMFYIPVQVFSFYAIYDGIRQPFLILKQALIKVYRHYRTCFYALLALTLVVVIYQFIMASFFDISSSFSAFQAVQDIMVQSNPFVSSIQYMTFAFQNHDLWGATAVSFVYGVIMCVVLVYYYMVMICAYDEDIKV